MHSSRTIRRLVLLLALALPLACVNPFKPADPEPPDSSGVPEDFRTPEDVLETMRLALESKSEGGANAWFHAFAESTVLGDRAYRAFYDGAVKQSWQTSTRLTAPEPWGVTLERGLPSKLFRFRPQAIYSFAWARDNSAENDDDPSAADTAQFHRKYTLLATDGNLSAVIAVGFCDLSFQRTGGRWSIFRWRDRVDPNVGVNPSTDERTMSWWRLESLAR